MLLNNICYIKSLIEPVGLIRVNFCQAKSMCM